MKPCFEIKKDFVPFTQLFPVSTVLLQWSKTTEAGRSQN